MHKFWTLARILFKNGALPGKTGSSRRNLALLIVAVAFLPLFIAETAIMWKVYSLIAPLHLTGVVLAGLLTAACAAMVLFGILYVISTYYFADDTVQLITMPIAPHRILASKFAVVTLFQYVLELLIVLPCLVVFGIRGGNFFYWLNASFIFVALPLIPTVICSVISILLMAFGKFFKNKDRVKFIAGLLAIVVAIGISAVMQLLGGQSSSADALKNSGSLIRIASLLFPSNLMAVKAILGGSAGSLLWLLLFLLLSATAVAIFLLLGNRLYLSGVVGLTQSTVHKRRMDRSRALHRRPAALALAIKDWRLLCRTPAFVLNCVLSAFLLPLILVGSLGFTLRGMVVPHADALTVALGVLFISLLSMMNMASPTAVSRDGRNASVSRFVPVPYKVQILGKLLPGLGMSLTALLLTVVPICFMFKPDAFTTVAICSLGAASLLTFNMFGLFVDIAFPKLDWDDETIAVKRNLNVGIEMLVMLATLALPAFLVYKLNLGLYSGTTFLILYHLLLLVAAAWLLFHKGPAFYGGVSRSNPAGKGKKYRKITRGAIGTVIVVAAIGWFGWEFFLVKTDVQITLSQVDVSAGLGESFSFSLSQIKTVYLKDNLPPTSGRVGFAAGGQLRGSFIVEGLGRGHVYTQNTKGPFLFVLLKSGGFTVFNFNDSRKTNNLYNTLKKYAAETP